MQLPAYGPAPHRAAGHCAPRPVPYAGRPETPPRNPFLRLFAISDLHLSFGVDKPMDIFGPQWVGHAERMQKALDAVEKSNTAFLEAQAIAQVTYGPQEAPKKKKTGN